MNRKLFLWLGVGVVVILVLFFILTKMAVPIFTKADLLTVEEAGVLAEERYSGKVIKISGQNNDFLVELERNNGLYEVIINRETGKVMSLTKISDQNGTGTAVEKRVDTAVMTEEEIKQLVQQKVAGEIESIERLTKGENIIYRVIVREGQTKTTVMMNGETGDILSQEAVHEEPVTKRLTEAEAASIALGVVNGTIDDVEIENINGIAYYFVEVETADGQEAKVEINAITGEVKSLTWDDDGDD